MLWVVAAHAAAQRACDYNHAYPQDYIIRAGSQLIAVFEDISDLSAAREMVDKLVPATLGTSSAVDVKITLGCVVIYITFKQTCLSGFDELANSLVAEGAKLTLDLDKDSHMGFLASETFGGTLCHGGSSQYHDDLLIFVLRLKQAGHVQIVLSGDLSYCGPI